MSYLFELYVRGECTYRFFATNGLDKYGFWCTDDFGTPEFDDGKLMMKAVFVLFVSNCNRLRTE